MASIHEIWQESLDTIKDRVTGRTVWETLDAVQPVTQEDDVIVLGLPHSLANQAGHLNYSTTRNSIEQVLGARMGTRVTIRVIEGVTLKDWEEVKKRQDAAKVIGEQQYVRKQKELSASGAWDDLHDQCARKFGTYANRSLSNVKGQYLFDCIQLVIEALQSVGEPDESAERNYARVLERIAQNAEVEPAVVEYAILERKRQLGS